MGFSRKGLTAAVADFPLGKDTGKGEAGTVLRPCPVCGKPAVLAARPFCSKRCANIDLHRWLSGTYAIPVSGETAADAAEPCAESLSPTATGEDE